MMKRNIRFYFGVIATLLASSLYAASYEDGQAAFEAKDYEEAVEIWEGLSEQGDINSLLKMAELYSAGLRVKKDQIVKVDRTTAFKLYNQAAEQGSFEAMLLVGQIYMVGQTDIEHDSEKAAEWYLKAAKQGYAKAQFFYGTSYFRGEGLPQDYVQAHAWMHVATIKGYEPAKMYSDEIAAVLSEEELIESKRISDQLLAEIK